MPAWSTAWLWHSFCDIMLPSLLALKHDSLIHFYDRVRTSHPQTNLDIVIWDLLRYTSSCFRPSSRLYIHISPWADRLAHRSLRGWSLRGFQHSFHPRGYGLHVLSELCEDRLDIIIPDPMTRLKKRYENLTDLIYGSSDRYQLSTELVRWLQTHSERTWSVLIRDTIVSTLEVLHKTPHLKRPFKASLILSLIIYKVINIPCFNLILRPISCQVYLLYSF